MNSTDLSKKNEFYERTFDSEILFKSIESVILKIKKQNIQLFL